MHPGEDEKGEKLPGISAVLATNAEQTELDGVLLDLAAVLDGLVNGNFEIIVVGLAGDGLAELQARSPTLPLRVLEGKYAGQAAALAAGFDVAVYDLLLVTGIDGEYDVRETNHLLEEIEHGAQLAIGYRPRRADGMVRRLHGWGWNMLVSLLFGKTGRDVDCLFKLFRTVVWQDVHLDGRKRNRTFNAEFLIRARRLGFVVAEVPVSHRRPRPPRRAAGPGEIGRALLQLGELRRGLGKADSPLAAPVPAGRQAA